MRLRPIRIDEKDGLLALLRQSAEWLQSKGSTQWSGWLNPGPELLGWVDNGLEAGEYYFAEDNDFPVGMVRVQYSDDHFWGAQTEPAGYLHSLATWRTEANRGAGKKILLEVEQRLKDEGIPRLRLDCGLESVELRRYYREHGFAEIRQHAVGDYRMVLMEKGLY